MPKNTYYQVACKEILGLRTNIKNFSWSFHQCGENDTESEYARCQLKMGLFLENDRVLLRKFSSNSLTQYSHFKGVPNDDRVFYQRTMSGNQQFLLVAEGLVKGEPVIYANPRYYRYIRIRLMNLHSLNFLLTDVAAFQLLRNGMAAIHCSAFKKDDRTVIIFAPSNTGKTLSVINICREYECFFMSEDMAITDGRIILGVPWTSTFFHYSLVESSFRSTIYRHLSKVFPPVILIGALRPKIVPVTSIIGQGRICDKSQVTHLIILERGKDIVTSIPRGEAYRKIKNLNRCEYNYIRSPLLMAYEFLNPEIDIEKAYQIETSILRKLVDGVEKCFLIRCQNPANFANKIMEALK